MNYGTQWNMALLEKLINWFLTNSIEIIQALTFENSFNERRNSVEYGPSWHADKLDFNDETLLELYHKCLHLKLVSMNYVTQRFTTCSSRSAYAEQKAEIPRGNRRWP